MLFRARYVQRRLRAFQRPLLWFFGILFLIDSLRIIRSRPRTVRIGDPSSSPEREHTSIPPNPSVFIVSVHRNTEPILRTAWVEALVNLVDHLGPQNVFVSAVESGSQEHTKDALIGLDALLAERNVPRRIELGPDVYGQLEELNQWADPNFVANETHQRPPGWVWHADENRYALRRIPYLAGVRNRAMAPLLELAANEGKRYDRILWINDVAFDTPDVLTLLHTRRGNYAAACALDFKSYPLFYDTFAMRDAWGSKPVSVHWPWFRSLEARADILAGRPTQVRSCWNGMVAFDAGPFYDVQEEDNSQPRLQFRGVPDSLAAFHLEGSECCLIHADNPLSEGMVEGHVISPDTGGVWVNPNVRVAYSVPTYHKVRRSKFPGMFMAVLGRWANRWERAQSRVQFRLEGTMMIRRLRQWRAETPEGEPPRSEPGSVCLINEMQIMWENGWKHL